MEWGLTRQSGGTLRVECVRGTILSWMTGHDCPCKAGNTSLQRLSKPASWQAPLATPPLSSADVAVHLTVATIEQLVRWRGSWDAWGLLWRVQQQGFAEMTFSRSDRLTTAVWRSSSIASPFSGEHNWPSTPRWFLRSAATEKPGDNALLPTELRCCRHEGAKLVGPWSEPDWWCSVARSGEGGPRSTAARAFALSLLDRRCCASADGDTPTTSEVTTNATRDLGVFWPRARRVCPYRSMFTLDFFSRPHHISL